MSTAILGARSERVRAIKDGLSRDIRAHASAATVDELVELWWSDDASGVTASAARPTHCLLPEIGPDAAARLAGTRAGIVVQQHAVARRYSPTTPAPLAFL
jgi:hypothetical protein